MTPRYPTPEEMALWLNVATGKHVPVVLPNPIKQQPDTLIDLHNLSVMQAYEAVSVFLSKLTDYDVLEVVIITGKSGIIRKEFPLWMEKKKLRFVELPNGGSFRVYIRNF